MFERDHSRSCHSGAGGRRIYRYFRRAFCAGRQACCTSISVLVFAAVVSTVSNATAQNFLHGINLYNHAEYDSLIFDYVPQFLLSSLGEEEGLAHYFLAESYYNKALADSDGVRVRDLLRRARQAFQLAAQSTDLRKEFNEYSVFARFKLGWCSYRLAEIAEQPAPIFRRAYAEFVEMARDAPDSIKVVANYMAAESKIQANLSLLYTAQDAAYRQSLIDDVFSSYPTIDKLYDDILRMQSAEWRPQKLTLVKNVVRLQKERLKTTFARLHLLASGALRLAETDRTAARDRHRERSRELLVETSYHDLFEDAGRLPDRFAGVLSYLNLVRLQQLFCQTRDADTKESFLTEWRNLDTPEFRAEELFRRANVYQGTRSDEFNYLAIAFYDSSRSIAESYYWLGYLNMIQGEPAKSHENLARFIALTGKGSQNDKRQRVLFEDALYRKYLLEFEAAYLRGNQKALWKLTAKLELFHPANAVVRERAEQLNLLANCSLSANTQQIWQKVLVGSDEQKMEQALTTVRFVLPRAAFNIGKVRQKYILLLDRLLEITGTLRSDETRFFRGIVKSMEAEIEATPLQKAHRFAEAADILRTVQPEYPDKAEADYVRARCLFFADEFDAASSIFERLVNEQHSLRASFYLAEIFRLEQNGMAAKTCYQNIITKLKGFGASYDEFWLSNARAGILAAGDDGDLTVLDSINLESVTFQPPLNPRSIRYEKLADEHFLKRAFARESVEWLLMFGLPAKQIYPSQHRLQDSVLSARNDFAHLSPAFDEVRGKISSTLVLQVVLPAHVKRSLEVVLDGKALAEVDGVFGRHNIPLNSELELVIRNPNCYEFRQVCKFQKLNEDRFVVRLNRKLTFVRTGKVRNVFEYLDYPFAHRSDENYVVSPLPGQGPGSQLVLDFAGNIALRDAAVDRHGDRILVVNAKSDEIWVYSNSSGSQRQGILELQGGTRLKSPEGIAVDSNGEIYVADWGNHRVVKLSGAGKFVQQLGAFGSNSDADVGHPIKLMFPTRLAVIESPADSRNQGDSRLEQDYLYVADYNGLHICKLDGTYLGTLISPGGEFERGSFYGFMKTIQPAHDRLYLIKRLDKARGEMAEFVSK